MEKKNWQGLEEHQKSHRMHVWYIHPHLVDFYIKYK